MFWWKLFSKTHTNLFILCVWLMEMYSYRYTTLGLPSKFQTSRVPRIKQRLRRTCNSPSSLVHTAHNLTIHPSFRFIMQHVLYIMLVHASYFYLVIFSNVSSFCWTGLCFVNQRVNVKHLSLVSFCRPFWFVVIFLHFSL